VVVVRPRRGDGRRYDHVVTDRWWLRPLVVADQPPPCSAEADEEFMVYRAGIARNDRDRLALQAELFRARFGG
jgi:hypothetical protein